MSLSFETLKIVATLFKDVSSHEHDVENARLHLSENTLFSPYEAFRRIDQHQIGDISDEDVQVFCNANGVYCSLQDATDLIGQYDENGDGRLSYAEFQQIVLSATSPSLRLLATGRDSTAYAPRRAYLASSLESELATVFQREINF